MSILIDLEEPEDKNALEFDRAHKDLFSETRIRYLAPLSAEDDLLGFISLGDPVKYRSPSLEEKDILQTIALPILNIKLSKRLRQAGEMEAFQTLAAFFVHDLKNPASKLSVMLKPPPVHFDNPEFRNDALRLTSQSVKEVDAICNRLSFLREKLEIHPVETDLNEVVKTVLSGV